MLQSTKKILIATGLFPPEIGGPANYAKALADEFKKRGYEVVVKSYTFEKKLPAGLRHLCYSWRIFRSVYQSDFIIALDTASVGWPAVFIARLLNRSVAVRIGGDFLWEQHVNRTRQSITLSSFYRLRPMFTLKEKLIWHLTGWLFAKATALVFTTAWQRDILVSAYRLKRSNIFIIDNFFGPRQAGELVVTKNFLWAGRPIFLKNLDRLRSAFQLANRTRPELKLDIITGLTREELLKKISQCYAVVLPSLSEVSPNLVAEAIMYRKPFIMTRDSGYAERFKQLGLLIDPLSVDQLVEKMIALANPVVYQKFVDRLRNFTYVHTYQDIAQEFIAIYNQLCVS